MIKIFCDGAYSSSRNQGGWSFIVIEDEKIIYKEYGGLLDTTNNRMEMMAALNAMKYINKHYSNEKEILIYCDSMLVIETLSGKWKMKKNLDLWPDLWNELEDNMKYIHVKGHSGDIFNSECDKWAVFGSNLLNCETDERTIN